LRRAAAAGAVLVVADLDQPHTGALVRLAQRIVHLAPPRSDGITDIRSQNLSAILPDKSRLVYVSTTGVWRCAGAKFDETRAINLKMRVPCDAWRQNSACDAGQTQPVHLIYFEVPGIYATDRLPVERCKKARQH
jgi:hypothetical protein